ncbi:hypothetical protein Syun_022104 [Stephania yunnanensis]|uniref:Homeobox domain-containing protein n=1 Tax=Stephania yunnanensis TaxID=152371 RepID=A0AAP0IIT3_9MAGN
MKMWMMGCSDGGGFNIADSLNGRRLRPLIPRPSSASSSSSSSSTTTTTVTSSSSSSSSSSTTTATATANSGVGVGIGIGGGTNVPCFTSRIHGSHDNHFVFNHHLMATTHVSHEQLGSKKDFGAPTVVSSRWNPTPEQLRTLEELYRHGTRTPTAEQIQQITAQLRRFGKIEGKNVFYWFQNHKARERQKRRRRLECEERETLDNKEYSGPSRTTDFEVEAETNKTCWATLPTHNFTTFSSEEMMWRPVVSESKTNGWMRFEDLELQKSIEKQQTWQPMQLCCSSSSSPTTTSTNTTTTTTTTTTAAETMRILNSSSSKLLTMTNNHQNHDYPPTRFPIGVLNDHRNRDRRHDDQSHTLQLFPLRSTAVHDDDSVAHQHVKENEGLPISVMDANSSAPYQFIEFL